MFRPFRILGIPVLVVASLLVTVPPAAAGTGTIGINFTLPAATRTVYSISGTVVANATSAVVSGVLVYASSTSGSGQFTGGSAISKASGAYTIADLLPGSYNLTFSPPRSSNLQHGYRSATGPTFFSATTAAAVTITTASRTGLNVRLPAGFRISGKVTRSNGTTPIATVQVSADGATGGDNTTTDSAGNYSLRGRSPGSYEVSFGHDNPMDSQTGCWYSAVASEFSASCLAHTAVVIGAANVSGINPRIPNGLTITGFDKTRAATPAPIVGAYVYANGPENQSATTDATGRYTITGLHPGAYKISLDGPFGSRYNYGYYAATGPNYWATATASASTVTISAAVTTLPIIKPGTGYFLKGKIMNAAGTGLDSVFVETLGGAGTAFQDPGAFTDVSGNYSIGPLPYGQSYKVKADPRYSSSPVLLSGWYRSSPPNNFTAAASSALAIVMTGDRTGINMKLPVGDAISGTVTITGGSACNFCEVSAISSTGALVTETATTAAGGYTLLGLPAGIYRIQAWAQDPVIDATHVRIITGGYYKSGAAPNFSATLAGATGIVEP